MQWFWDLRPSSLRFGVMRADRIALIIPQAGPSMLSQVRVWYFGLDRFDFVSVSIRFLPFGFRSPSLFIVTASDTAVAPVFRAKILHGYGFDPIRALSQRGEVPQHTGNSSGKSTPRILVCEMVIWQMAVEPGNSAC